MLAVPRKNFPAAEMIHTCLVFKFLPLFWSPQKKLYTFKTQFYKAGAGLSTRGAVVGGVDDCGPGLGAGVDRPASTSIAAECTPLVRGCVWDADRGCTIGTLPDSAVVASTVARGPEAADPVTMPNRTHHQARAREEKSASTKKRKKGGGLRAENVSK